MGSLNQAGLGIPSVRIRVKTNCNEIKKHQSIMSSSFKEIGQRIREKAIGPVGLLNALMHNISAMGGLSSHHC